MGVIRLGLAVALAGLLALPTAATSGGGLDRIPREKILAAAREIDRLVELDLAANGQKPNPMLGDVDFLRRVYLDLAGRIPTAKEVLDFTAAPASDRREALIDRLLESPAYGSHLFNWLADLLRVKSRLQNNISGEPYIHFLKESIASNKPWDVFVRDLLTASGPAHKRGHGATGYYLRDRGMVEDNMSNTITLFLGTRLECAQCHNHPFDKWTQMQYHEMVAFTGGMRFTDDTFPASPEGKRLMEMGQAFKSEKGKQGDRSPEFREFRKLMQPLEYGISGTGNGLYRLPKDYQYEDAKANQVVKARAMFGNEAAVAVDIPADRKAAPPAKKPQKAPPVKAADANTRETYAKWLTSPENPRFTTVIANRLWKRFFGLGVIEPVDNLRETTKAVNPGLMKHLESTMSGLGYDLKQYLRVLANSRTYQREACAKEPSEDVAFRFNGPLLRRMNAEQIWDSIVTLMVPDIDATLNAPGAAAEGVYADYERLANVGADDLKVRVELEVLRQKDPAKFRELKAKEAAEARAALKADQDLQKKLQALHEAHRAAKKKGDEEAAKRLKDEAQALERSKAPLLMPEKGMYRKAGAGAGLLSRASDLPQPAAPGHFLREFGQSDREQIEASHRDGSVPQALSLLNGFVDKTILPNAKAAVRLAADAAKAPSEKAAAVFRCVLSREPSAKERETWAPDVEKRGDAAIRDLIWTLVNTHEFMFVR